MLGDIGSWTGSAVENSEDFRITFKSPEGYLNFTGSPEACQKQLEEWQQRYVPLQYQLSTPGIYTKLDTTAGSIPYIKPSDKGLKYDTGKPALDLLPPDALNDVAEVLQFGAKKYARGNYRKGLQYSRLISAALRHIMAFNNGEDKDKESNLNHIAHAACCLLFLLEMQKYKPEMDDRWTKDK